MSSDLEKDHPKEYQAGFVKGESLYEEGKKLSLVHAKGKYETTSQIMSFEIGLMEGYAHADKEDHKTKEHGKYEQED